MFWSNTYAGFWTKMFVYLAYTSKWYACVVLFRLMRPIYDVCVSLTDVNVVFLTCMCVLTLHIRWFSNKNVCLSYVYIKNWCACVVFFRLMRQIYDVCVSLTDVSVVFLTCMCVLTLHIRWFSDKDVCSSYVYIKIDTHALYY